MEDESKYVPMGTKVAPWAAEVWNAICDNLETDTYHLLQLFIYAMIRASSSAHELSPEVKRLLNVIDLDVAWQRAINLVSPTTRLKISRLIMIVEQEKKEGFAAIMLDKPFMEEVKQTENADEIFETLAEVIYKRTYSHFRRLSARMHMGSQRAMLEQLIETQEEVNREASDYEESTGINDYAENNRRVQYGKRTKRSKHLGIDSKGFQRKILFNNQPEDD